MRIRGPISNDVIHSDIRPDGDFIIVQEQWTEEQYDVMIATFQLFQKCYSAKGIDGRMTEVTEGETCDSLVDTCCAKSASSNRIST